MGRVTRFLQATNQTQAEPAPGKSATAADRVDQDLERVITTWPVLPRHIRKAILTLVNAGKTERSE